MANFNREGAEEKWYTSESYSRDTRYTHCSSKSMLLLIRSRSGAEEAAKFTHMVFKNTVNVLIMQ